MGLHPLSSISFWKRINRLRRNETTKNVVTLEINRIKITTDEGKTNALADRLEQVFKNESHVNFDKDHQFKTNQIFENEGIFSFYQKSNITIKTFSINL